MRGMVRIVALLVVLGLGAGLVGLDAAAAQDKDKKVKKDSAKQAKDKGKEAAGAATFEIYKDKGGKFRFRFMGSDGTELAMSPRGYTDKADIQKAIDAIRRDAAKAKVQEAK